MKRGTGHLALATSLLLLSPLPARALPLPPDPFDATDRFALVLRDPTGRLVEIQAKIRSPGREDLPAGELLAVLRYQVRTAQGLSQPRVAASRPLLIEGLSATSPVLVRFSFSPALAPTEILHPRLKIFYRAPKDRSPPSTSLRLVKDFFSEEILFGSTAASTQTTVSPPALASPGTVLFGPLTLMRARGTPATDTLTFSVPDTTGPFLFQLTNGNPTGAHRVSSAVVTLNGQQVFRPRDFNQQVAGLTRQVVLQPNNTLSVELRSAPGATVTLQIVRLDQRACRAFGPKAFTRRTGKPILEEVTFPRAPQLTGPFTLHLQSGDAAGQNRVDSAIITLNGQTVFSPGDFNEQVSTLSRTVDLLAMNTLSVELRGAPGDFLTLEITGFDNTPPTVRVTSPLPGTVVTQGPITVSGTVDDPTVSVVVIPQLGQPSIVAPVAADGTWTATGVIIQEGENLITARATDPCGNEGEDSITVTLRTLPAPPTVELCLAEFGPEIAAVSIAASQAEGGETPACPKEGITNTPVAFLVGTVSDPGTRVTVQGEVVENFDGFFSAFVPLTEGLNTVTAVTTDTFGQTGTDRVTITLDTVAPGLTLSEPTDGIVTAAASITVSGQSEDPTATVFVNGEPVPVADSLFTATVPLEEGENFLFVDAIDPAFNVTSFFLTITRDSQPPAIVVTAPLDGSGVTEAAITLTGAITDATIVSATVTLRGITQVLLVLAGRFSAPLTLVPGLNVITVSAIDQAGNTATAPIRVTLVAAGTTTVTGRVISQDLSSPLAGATVAVPFTILLAVTGSDGRFVLTAVPAGNELLTAARPGYLTRTITAPVPPAETLDVGDIALTLLPSTPGTITFSGTIRDATTGEPLAGVNVVVSNVVQATTGVDGTFLIRDLAKNTFYAVRFERVGYETVRIPVQFYSTNFTFIIQMRPTTGTLRGTITAAATGAPLAGALVTVTGAGGTVSTTSGTDGRYSLPGLLPGAITGTVTKAGFTPASFSGTVVVGPANVFDVALVGLGTTATLTGMVTDATTGAPLAEATVSVTDAIRSLTATTGADGRYTLTGVTPGDLTGSFARTGFVRALFSARLTAGQTLTVNISLQPLPQTPTTVTLTGRVTNASTGTVLAGATLTATSGLTTFTGTSGADGLYTISGIPPGTLTIGVAAPGFFSQTFTVNAPSGGIVTLDVALIPSPFTLTITSPADGALLNQDRVLVRGTVSATFAREIGVVVNGVLALVDGTQWIAEVPLTQGTNVLTATATAPGGQAISRSITVRTDEPREPLLVLRASPVSGLAPLTVTFTGESGLSRPIVQFAFDADGDGTVDRTSTTFDTIAVTYTGRGLVIPTLTVTDDQGQTVTARTIVQVLDLSETVAMFQEKWEALKAALATRDIPRATIAFAFGVRARFERVFQALNTDLPTIAPTLGTVAITRVVEGLAEGAITRIQGGQVRLYFLYWTPDADGIWRIIEM